MVWWLPPAGQERALNCGKDNKHQSWPSFFVLVVVAAVVVALRQIENNNRQANGQTSNMATALNTAQQSPTQHNTTQQACPVLQGDPSLSLFMSPPMAAPVAAPATVRRTYKMPKTAALHGVAPSPYSSPCSHLFLSFFAGSSGRVL